MKTQSPDTSPEAERVFIGLLRQATPARKLRMMEDASLATKRLALAGLRQRHPAADERELKARLAVLLFGKELGGKVASSLGVAA
jgi:hypothetical protein